MAKSKHDMIAEYIAKREGVEYNKGKGPDILGRRRVIEVATHESDLISSKKQLQGFKKPRYIAINSALKKKAIESTKGTSIGVMDGRGRVIKYAGKQPGRPPSKKKEE